MRRTRSIYEVNEIGEEKAGSGLFTYEDITQGGNQDSEVRTHGDCHYLRHFLFQRDLIHELLYSLAKYQPPPLRHGSK